MKLGSRYIVSNLMLLTCGCGAAPLEYIHPDLQEDVAAFHEIAGPGVYPVASITFGRLPSPRLGVCQVFSTGVRRIVIHEDLREAGDFRRDTVFHEMVHCSLGRMGHTPSGLMAAGGNPFQVEAEGGPEMRLSKYLDEGN
jgi:hypothetical protein